MSAFEPGRGHYTRPAGNEPPRLFFTDVFRSPDTGVWHWYMNDKWRTMKEGTEGTEEKAHAAARTELLAAHTRATSRGTKVGDLVWEADA